MIQIVSAYILYSYSFHEYMKMRLKEAWYWYNITGWLAEYARFNDYMFQSLANNLFVMN